MGDTSEIRLPSSDRFARRDRFCNGVRSLIEFSFRIKVARLVAHSKPDKLVIFALNANRSVSAWRSTLFRLPVGLFSRARMAASRFVSAIVTNCGATTLTVTVAFVATSQLVATVMLGG